MIFQIVLWGNSFPFLFCGSSFLIWPAVEAEPRQNEPRCVTSRPPLACQNSQQLLQEKINMSTHFKRGNQRGFHCSMAQTHWDATYPLVSPDAQTSGMELNFMLNPKHLDTKSLNASAARHREFKAANKTNFNGHLMTQRPSKHPQQTAVHTVVVLRVSQQGPFPL